MKMNLRSHRISTAAQVVLIGTFSMLLGIVIPFQPKVGLVVILLLGFIIYLRTVLISYQMILVAIILVIPFNFESLIAMINIPYVNPFNLLWISYVGIVLLRTAAYSEPLLVRSPIDVVLFGLILWYSFSTVHSYFVVGSAAFSHHIFPTFQQWAQWALFYFFCLKGIKSEKDAKQVITWVLVFVFFAGLENIRDYLVMVSITSGDGLERASGLFSNANYSASFFCYYVPLAIGLALTGLKKRVHRLGFLLISVVGMAAVVVTYSRGGMASIMLAAGIIALFSRINIKLILVGIVAGIVLISSGNISKRISQTSVEGPYGESVDPSVQARLIAWSKAFVLIKEKPVIGQGFFTFRYIKVEPFEEEAAKAHGDHGMAVHNGFINVLVNAGLIGFGLFAALLGIVLRTTWVIFRSSRDRFWKGAAIGLFAGTISLILVNLSGTRLYDRQMIAYFWILLAALYRGYHYYRANNPED